MWSLDGKISISTSNVKNTWLLVPYQLHRQWRLYWHTSDSQSIKGSVLSHILELSFKVKYVPCFLNTINVWCLDYSATLLMMSLAIEKYLFLRGEGEVIFLTIYGSLFGEQCYSIVKWSYIGKKWNDSRKYLVHKINLFFIVLFSFYNLNWFYHDTFWNDNLFKKMINVHN